MELCPRPYRVRGDAARLRQVVVNLLSNSVKFTAAGGRVRVALTCQNQSAVLVVGDNAIGIHPDSLPRVFQAFRQNESNASTGLGLGVGIVKTLVELHGGTVAAEPLVLAAARNSRSRFHVPSPPRNRSFRGGRGTAHRPCVSLQGRRARRATW